MGPVGGRLDGRRVGQRAEHVEIGPDHRYICLFGCACELEHLGLALVAEVRRVGACLLENRRELLGWNRISFFEVDLDAPVCGLDVAACGSVFRCDDNRLDAQPPTGTRDAGRGLSAPQDQYFLEHQRSIATDSRGAPRGPA